MNDEHELGLGLIGCGAFGRFCVEVFGQIEGIRIVRVADTCAGGAMADSAVKHAIRPRPRQSSG